MSMRGETRRKGERGAAGGRRTSNVFKFMAAFKTPSAGTDVACREPLCRRDEEGELQRRERGSLGGKWGKGGVEGTRGILPDAF